MNKKKLTELIEEFLVRLEKKEGTAIGTTTRDEIIKEMIS